MILLREILAVVLFAIACTGVVSLVVDGFAWVTFCILFLCFWLAWWVWPSRRKGQRQDDNSVADFVELFIELPFEMFLWLLRLVGRLFKDGDAGIDL